MKTRTLMMITALLAMTLTSCSSGDKSTMKNTITQQQAGERAERYIREAVAGLIPPARLEVLSSFDDSPCDDPTDNGPKGRVIASRGYWLNDISPDQHSAYVDDLVRWWSEHNFTVLTDNRPGNVYVWAENRHDGFRMAIQQTEIGPKRLSLGATSPCVWPNGTPEPQSP